MSNSEQTPEQAGNGLADALATTTVVAIVIGTVVFWLSGMPS